MNDAVPMLQLEQLSGTLADPDPSSAASIRLDRLIRAGLDRLPLPGSGATVFRWQALSASKLI